MDGQLHFPLPDFPRPCVNLLGRHLGPVAILAKTYGHLDTSTTMDTNLQLVTTIRALEQGIRMDPTKIMAHTEFATPQF